MTLILILLLGLLNFSFSQDTTPPTVLSTIPENNSSNVPIDFNISIEFSEPVDMEWPGISLNGEWCGGATISGSTIRPRWDQQIMYDTLYTVVVSTEVQDLAGNYMENSYTFSFTTEPEPFNLEITYPTTGDVLEYNKTYSIIWNDNIEEKSAMKIELLKSDSLIILLSNSAGENSYDWTVPDTLIAGDDYSIKLTSIIDTNINVVSPDLSIRPPIPDNPPTLLSPFQNSSIDIRKPTFQWSEVAYADYYRVLVDDDSFFFSPEIDFVTADTTHTDSVELGDQNTYYWKVCAINISGIGNFSDNGSFYLDTTGILDTLLPDVTQLYQNHPNPFNPLTEIKYDLAQDSPVKLTIYNISGQLVSELFNGQRNAGMHTVSFDASDLNSGMYFYTLEANGATFTRKMILTK